MNFVLPTLPYSYDALEPYIDAQTMEIHYTKHHQGYINNLTAAVAAYPDVQIMSAQEMLMNMNIIPESIATVVKNNAGGHYNHSLFWIIMKKNGDESPVGLLAQAIEKEFQSFQAFKTTFNTHARSLFGSGWVWLSVDKNGRLVLAPLSNQDSPLLYQCQPIMGLDVWEHAYYLKYQNRRTDYIDAWWHVLDWKHIEDRYNAIIKTL